MRRPSGDHAADQTRHRAWPESTASCTPAAASQMRAVWSAEAVTMRRPSGDHAAGTEAHRRGRRARRAAWPWPRPRCVRCGQRGGDDASPIGQIRTPTRRHRRWPESTASCFGRWPRPRCARSGQREAVTMRRPSGENAAAADGSVVARKYGELSGRGRVPDARGLCR